LEIHNNQKHKILSYKGYSVCDIGHSFKRYTDLVSDEKSLYTELFNSAIQWMIDNMKVNIEDRYIFRSSKYGFGIQMDWIISMQDKNSSYGYTCTAFTKEEMDRIIKIDKEAFVDNFVYHGEQLENSRNIVEKGYGRFTFNQELQDELNLIGMDVFIQDGLVHYTYEMIQL